MMAKREPEHSDHGMRPPRRGGGPLAAGAPGGHHPHTAALHPLRVGAAGRRRPQDALPAVPGGRPRPLPARTFTGSFYRTLG